MKQFITPLLVLLATMALTSCEKLIDVELRDADKKYVIEGVLTDQPGSTQVRISQTKSYSASNSFEGVNGADVRIVEEDGSRTQLTQKAAGVYESEITGQPGKKYTLLVTIGATEFRAVSQMPAATAISGLFTAEMEMGTESGKYLNVVFQDPPEAGNFYRLVQFINGKKEKHIYTRNDDLSNGRLNTVPLFNHDGEVKKGDSIKVELQSIDAAVYKYWYSLSRNADGGQSASPANPVTNFSGGALGYFSAHATSEKTIVVQ